MQSHGRLTCPLLVGARQSSPDPLDQAINMFRAEARDSLRPTMHAESLAGAVLNDVGQTEVAKLRCPTTCSF